MNNIIKKLRTEKGYTQKELANELGISPSMVAMIEKDKRRPNDETKIKICEIFNISMDYLMGTEGIDMNKYISYLEEKLMYALGPKHKEFSENTRFNFKQILKNNFKNDGDTYIIHRDFLKYYKDGGI